MYIEAVTEFLCILKSPFAGSMEADEGMGPRVC